MNASTTRMPARLPNEALGATPLRWAKAIGEAWQKSTEAIFETGRLITQAKQSLGHGVFTKMVEEQLPFGPRTARRLMAIANDERLSNGTHVSVLPPHWGTLYELTKLDDSTLDRQFKDGIIRPDMERSEIRQSLKREHREYRELLLAAKQKALPQRKFGVIYADPEWPFDVWSDAGKDRAAENHYPTSALEVIEARPVSDLAAEDAVLFLWVPMAHLAAGSQEGVVKAWGFTPKAVLIWDKVVAGTGYWVRNRVEALVIAVRGTVPAPSMGSQWDDLVSAPKTQHSEKPDWAYELIESYFPNMPKIELNARRRRDGWDAWGLEAPEIDGSFHESVSPAGNSTPDNLSAATSENNVDAVDTVDTGKLTPAQIAARIREGYVHDEAVAEIARATGLSPNAVQKRAMRKGLTSSSRQKAAVARSNKARRAAP